MHRDPIACAARHGERGGARLKFLIVAALIATAAYAGYQYVPVAYNAYLFRDFMQESVDKAVALNHNGDWVREQLSKSAGEYGVPQSAKITPSQSDGSHAEVRVQFTRDIPLLPGYTYQYEFDHTAKSREVIVH